MEIFIGIILTIVIMGLFTSSMRIDDDEIKSINKKSYDKSIYGYENKHKKSK